MATESLYYSPPVSSETGEPASSCPQGRDRVGPEAVVETPKARLHFRYPEQCLPCRAGGADRE